MTQSETVLTERLLLRPLTLADAEAFFRYRSLPEVCRFQSFQPKTMPEIEAFLRANESTQPDIPGTWRQLAVCLQDGTLIGDVGLHTLDEWQLELGYTLAPEQQGKGYATEAVAAVLRQAFSVWNKHRVTASVDPENRASIRLLERLGFRKEAHFRKSYRINGEWVDDCVYALLREDWAAQDHPRVEIVDAYAQLDEVRALFSEYAASLPIDLGYQNFSAELSSLPGKYAVPDGRLFLALVDGQSAGCIALRRFDITRAEMKRLYVRPGYRGLRLGRLLAERAIDAAREAGYAAILLDTLSTMDRAKQLYRQLGFVEIEPYYNSPVIGTTFLQLSLAQSFCGNVPSAPTAKHERKRLYILGGTMGVGKTTTSHCLQQRLPKCVFLDGDWCWSMHPFQLTEETKRMAMDNICYLLGSFLNCSAFENIVFCWVLHEQSILDELLARLDTAQCDVYAVSLVCKRQALIDRIKKDVDAGIRSADVLKRSVERIGLYDALKTDHLDVSAISPDQAAEEILQRCPPN